MERVLGPQDQGVARASRERLGCGERVLPLVCRVGSVRREGPPALRCHSSGSDEGRRVLLRLIRRTRREVCRSRRDRRGRIFEHESRREGVFLHGRRARDVAAVRRERNGACARRHWDEVVVLPRVRGVGRARRRVGSRDRGIRDRYRQGCELLVDLSHVPARISCRPLRGKEKSADSPPCPRVPLQISPCALFDVSVPACGTTRVRQQ